MRRGRTTSDDADEPSGPPRQRRRAAGQTVAAAAAVAAPNNRRAVEHPRRQGRRAAAGEESNDGSEGAAAAGEDGAATPELPHAADDDTDAEQGPEGEQPEDLDNSNERDAQIAREMGLMPPGASGSEDEGEGLQGELQDELEDEFEEDEEEEEGFNGFPEPYGSDPDEDEDDEGEDEADEEELGAFPGPMVLPGGPDWNMVIGMPQEPVVRARGAVPERQPGDVQVTDGVWAREQPDSRHILYGPSLANCPKLLSRIFKMQQQPGQLLWRSELGLTGHEWQYLRDVLAHERIQQLLRHGRRVLAPLPEFGFPQRFRPRDNDGTALSGPRISRNGKEWNVGRQYFSSFKDGDSSSFIWADGVRAMEPEAQESFQEHMGGMGGMGGMFGFF